MNKADRIRDTAIRGIGCICCLREGLGFRPAEKHHLLTTGLHGNGSRRGEQFTVGLCAYHHRGIGSPAHYRSPSLAREPKAFRARYGDDEALLAEQNRLIDIWKESFIGGIAA